MAHTVKCKLFMLRLWGVCFQAPSGQQEIPVPPAPQAQQPPVILLEEITDVQYMARGGNGTVHRGRFRGIPVVIKVPTRRDAESQRLLINEYIHMAAAAHPYVLKCYALLGTRNPTLPYCLGLVIEAGHCDLERMLFMPTPDGQARSIAQVAGWLAGPARAVQHLHAMGAVHGDIKPANFILGLRGKLLLSDFGFAQLVGNPGAPAVPGRLTPLFASPEALRNQSPTSADDVWAFGMTMYMAAAQRKPFNARTLNELFTMICQYRLPFLPPGWHPLFRGLLVACWHPDPAQRPTMAAIAACLESLQHPALAMPQ
jgi:serine/threonine protein kinase